MNSFSDKECSTICQIRLDMNGMYVYNVFDNFPQSIMEKNESRHTPDDNETQKERVRNQCTNLILLYAKSFGEDFGTKGENLRKRRELLAKGLRNLICTTKLKANEGTLTNDEDEQINSLMTLLKNKITESLSPEIENPMTIAADEASLITNQIYRSINRDQAREAIAKNNALRFEREQIRKDFDRMMEGISKWFGR